FDIEVFDPLQDLAAKSSGVLYWHYPPTFVALIYPLGHLSPGAALAWFTVLTVLVWGVTVYVMIDTKSWIERLPVLLCPAVYMTIIGGQNGAFTAALLCLFILGVVRNRDWMIVVACTLLLAKPHFGVLMPVVLIALQRYRAFALSALFGSAFLGWSVWMTGIEYVEAFFANAASIEGKISASTLIDKQHTLFSFLSSLNVPQGIALGLQSLLALGIIGLTWVTFRSERLSQDLKVAYFLIGSVMISPYAFIYDGAAAVIGMWYLHRGTREAPIPGQNLIIALAWLMPYVNRWVHERVDVSWAGLSMLFLLAILIVHVRREMVAKPT
ncbi:MAG: glycosyltransferase family 87 protein, partial [Pseudomonadota bacterium]